MSIGGEKREILTTMFRHYAMDAGGKEIKPASGKSDPFHVEKTWDRQYLAFLNINRMFYQDLNWPVPNGQFGRLWIEGDGSAWPVKARTAREAMTILCDKVEEALKAGKLMIKIAPTFKKLSTARARNLSWQELESLLPSPIP